MSDRNDYADQLAAAKALGAEYAANGIEAGEFRPEESPLSGEWADRITPRDIPRMLGLEVPEEDADWILSDFADAWEAGYLGADWPVFRGDYADRAIVGYMYQAEEYTPEALHARIIGGAPWMRQSVAEWLPSDGPRNWIEAGILAPAARDMPIEDVLNQAAAYLGIDRDDETSFDSDDFPKLIIYGQS